MFQSNIFQIKLGKFKEFYEKITNGHGITAILKCFGVEFYPKDKPTVKLHVGVGAG